MNAVAPTPGVSSAGLPDAPLVFQFALSYEAEPFLRNCKLVRWFDDAPCEGGVYSHGEHEFVVLITGMGQDRAHAALTWLLDQVRPSLVVSAGFAGALVAGIKVGAVVVPNEVIESADLRWPCQVNMLELTNHLVGGRLVSLSFPLLTAEEKSRIGWKFQAAAVDLESSEIAELCENAHVPFAAARAISDTMMESVPHDLFQLIDGGRADWRRVAWLVIRKPWLIPKLIRSGLHGRIAARNLARHLRLSYFPERAGRV